MFFDLFKGNSGARSDNNEVTANVVVNPGVDIPEDLKDFLTQGKQLDYDRFQCDAGLVKLKNLQSLKVENVEISTKRVKNISEQDDPNKNRNGAYIVPAVSLISECRNFDPDFILLWLPGEKMFGSLGGEYVNELLVFPNASWTDIVNDPIPYINSQWRADYNNVAQDFNPWQKYPFKG